MFYRYSGCQKFSTSLRTPSHGAWQSSLFIGLPVGLFSGLFYLDCHAALAMMRYKENVLKSENFWQTL